MANNGRARYSGGRKRFEALLALYGEVMDLIDELLKIQANLEDPEAEPVFVKSHNCLAYTIRVTSEDGRTTVFTLGVQRRGHDKRIAWGYTDDIYAISDAKYDGTMEAFGYAKDVLEFQIGHPVVEA